MAPKIADLASGLVFGAALYAAGVFAPAVIIDQLSWRNTAMLRAFMTASGASALIFRIAHDAGFATLPNREARNLGLFEYDGNVVGGALIGVGMAVTGACPGTVFVQAAIAVPQAKLMLLGGVLGGWLARFVPLKPAQKASGVKQDSSQLHPWIVLAVWEAVCVTVVRYSTIIDQHHANTDFGLVSPVVGGLLIGIAQATTIVLRKQPLGISAAFSDLGSHISKITLKPNNIQANNLVKYVTPSLLFAAGVMLGSWGLSQIRPGPARLAAELGVGTSSSLLAFVGSTLMCLGARVAGGCTSGHGISGMSAFRFASIVTTAAMFAAGTLTAVIA